MQSYCNGPLRTKMPISGLYAAANDMTAIGPDLTFGYIAA